MSPFYFPSKTINSKPFQPPTGAETVTPRPHYVSVGDGSCVTISIAAVTSSSFSGPLGQSMGGGRVDPPKISSSSSSSSNSSSSSPPSPFRSAPSPSSSSSKVQQSKRGGVWGGGVCMQKVRGLPLWMKSQEHEEKVEGRRSGGSKGPRPATTSNAWPQSARQSRPRHSSSGRLAPVRSRVCVCVCVCVNT